MPLIEDHKLIFQHLPKTGGMAILDKFNTPTAGHHHMSYYNKKIKERGLLRWERFTIIRDPVERFISALGMYLDPPDEQLDNDVISRCRANHPEIFEAYDINKNLNFKNLQNLIVDMDAFHFWPAFSFYANSVDLPPGSHTTTVGPDERFEYVFPNLALTYENLQEDFSYLCDLLQLDIDPTLRQVNSSKFKPILTTSSRELIEKVYAVDYQILNEIYNSSYVQHFKRNP